MNDRKCEMIRAVFLAAIMALSMVAMVAAGFAGTAVAQDEPEPGDNEAILLDADGEQVGNDSYATIQAAVNDVETADAVTVLIGSGTYEESVTIDVEGLTLEGPNAGLAGDNNTRGSEATITQGVEINASGVTLDGLDVTNSDVNGIVITEAPSDVTVTNTVVRDIAGGTAGPSKGVGNGVNLQFNDVFEQTSTGIEVTNNLITGVTTPDASGNSPDADAIGVQLLPRGNDVVDLRVANNTIENIEPGAASGGRSEARAVSIATQFTNADGQRGDFGQATNLTVADNDVSNLTADFARAVNLFEDKGGDTTTNDALGPVNFTVTGNTVTDVDSTSSLPDLAMFVGEYGNFGADHSVQRNNFLAGVENFGGSSDNLTATENWWGNEAGPGFDGPGVGPGFVIVDGEIDFDPWLNASVPGGQPVTDGVFAVENLQSSNTSVARGDTVSASVDVTNDLQAATNDRSAGDVPLEYVLINSSGGVEVITSTTVEITPGTTETVTLSGTLSTASTVALDSETLTHRIRVATETSTAAGASLDVSYPINAAISAAESGETVTVRAGTYEESVTADVAGLIIESAASATPTVVGQSSNAVTVGADDVTVSGLDIQNPTGSGDGNTSVNAVGVKVDPANTNVTIENNSIGPVGTAVNTNVIGVYVERDADDVTVTNNTLSTLDGTVDDEDRTQAILLIAQEGGNVGSITGATIFNNTITNVTDTRSVKAIEFNGNISGSIAENDISDLDTDGPAGTGFTQAIALGQGSNANTGPSDVLIENNTVSNLEPGTQADFAAPSHIILSAADDVSTIDITDNEFSALADDELFVLDRATGNFDLQGALDANTFTPSAVQVTDGSDRALVPDTGVRVVNVDQNTGFDQIQPAVDGANTGDTIEAKAGTFDESQLSVNVPGLTIEGSGNTVIDNTAGGGATVRTIATDITITNLTVTNSGGGNGFDVPTTQNASGLQLDDVTISDTSIAFFNDLTTNGGPNDDVEQDFSNVVFSDVTIENSERKGIYTEALSDAIFDNVTIDGVTSDSYGFNSGIDINLKYDDYENITIRDSTVANVSEGDPFRNDPSFSTAIAVKARDDPFSYDTNPATLDDVTIDGVTIEDSFNGLRIGEPGVDYSSAPEGPSNVTITDSTFRNVSANGYYVEDVPGNLDLNAILNNQNNNFDPDGEVVGDQILVAGTAPGNTVVNLDSGATFTGTTAIQDAVDNADSNNTLRVGPGTFTESVTIDVEGLSIEGPNAGTPADESRSDEAIISGTVEIVGASGVTVDGFKIAEGSGQLNSGVSIQPGSSGADGITVTNSIIENMSAAGGGGPGDFSFGILSFGGNLSDVTITDSRIANIGDPGGTQGVAVSLQSLTGTTAGTGATVKRNTIRNISSLNSTRVGTGVALRSNFNGNDSAAVVANNGFAGLEIAVSHPIGDTVDVDRSDLATVPVPNRAQRIFTPTVQDAVTAAESGDTVEVGPGTFEESVTIDVEGLTLAGAGADATTIVGDGENVGSRPHAAIHVDDGSGPVRNVTIEGFSVENPNGKFGIFAGTGTTNANNDGIGGLVIRDNVVQDVSTQSFGSALTGGPAGIAIRGDYGTDGNPGIEISNNEIDNVENLQGGPEPVGITLKSFTGNAGFGFDSTGASVTDAASPPATDTDILNNEISNISSNGGFATKGISVSGEFEDVDIIGNSLTGINGTTDGDARAITLSENGGSYEGNEYDIDGDGNGERIGPQDFDIRNNEISDVTGDARSINFGGYEVFGDHTVSQNTINDGAVTRFAGDQPGYQPGDGDALNASENTFTDSSADLYYSDATDAADLDAVFNDNDFSQVDVVVGSTAITRPPTSGEVLNVDQVASFNSIQTAVDSASAGNTIAVGSGTFTESVTVDVPSVTVESAASATPTVVGQSSVTVSIQSPGVTLSDLTIQNPQGDRGVRATDDATNVKIARNTIENVGTEGAFNQSRGILVSSLLNGDSASGLEIRNNTVDTVQGTGGNADQTIGIQILEESNGGGLIENVVVDGNTVTDLLDNRSSQGINFNGNIEGDITNNSISTLNTDRPGADLGFTQAIALNAGGNAGSAPQNVDISGNSISNLDDQTPSSESFRATHIILSSVDDVGTIDITNNEFTAVASDENYILDRASGDFDLQGALSANTFAPDAVQVIDGSDRVLVPETGVDVVNVDQNTGFEQIQDAVDNANSDNTLRVGPGTFTESVTINTDGLTLEGPNAGLAGTSQNRSAEATIIGQGPPAIETTAAGVNISGLTITNPTGDRGIRATGNATDVLIQNNVVTNVNTQTPRANQSRGIIIFDSNFGAADGIEIRNNSVSNIEGSEINNEEQTMGIQLFETKANGGLVENVVVDGNTIDNISDARSTVGIDFNGNIEGDITNNDISGLNTEDEFGSFDGFGYTAAPGFNDEPDDGAGFTDGIRLSAGGAASSAPQNVTISGNEISELETTSRPNFAPATHIDLGVTADDLDTITIEDNELTVANRDDGAELYISAPRELNMSSVVEDNTLNGNIVVGERAVSDTIQVQISPLRQDLPADEVRLAEPGDTITVRSGTYEESVRINVPDLSLEGPNAGTPGDSDARGAEAVITGGSGNTPGVQIAADNVTLDGLQVENTDTNGIRFGPDTVPSNVTIQNSVVTSVTGDIGGKSAGNGIQFQFSNVANETAQNIQILDNEISNITTPDATSIETIATGVNVLPRGNNVSLEIRGNTFTDIEPGTSKNNRAEARGVSLSTQDDNLNRFGRVDGAVVTNNTFDNISAGDNVRAVALFEEDDLNPREGVKNFSVTRNNFTSLSGATPETTGALFVGGYETLGADHVVTENNFKSGGVLRFTNASQIGSGFDPSAAEDLNAVENWWGNPSGPSGAGPGVGNPVSENVTFDPWLDAPFPAGQPATDGDIDLRDYVADNETVAGGTLNASATVENGLRGVTTNQGRALTVEHVLLANDNRIVLDSTSVDVVPGTTETVSFVNSRVPDSVSSDSDAEHRIEVRGESVNVSQSLTVLSPANFTVTIDDTPNSVTAGDDIQVNYTVENVGDQQGTQDIDLSVNGTNEGTESDVTLNGGETFSDSFIYTTAGSDVPEVTVAVSSANDTASETVTVEELTPANFAVSINDAASTTDVTAGEDAVINATIENTGDGTATQTINFSVNGTTEDNVSVNLAGGAIATVEFTYTTEAADDGATAAVASDDASDSTQLTVTEPANFAVAINDGASTTDVTAGENAVINATIENTGDETATQTIEFTVGGTSQDSVSVNLAGGATETVEFTYTTEAADDGATATVASDDNSDSTQLTVTEPANFAVTINDGASTTDVTAGENAVINATIENTGDETATQTINFTVGGTSQDSVSVNLSGGATETVEFSFTTDADDDGATAAVASDDASDSTQLTVTEPANFAVTINDGASTTDVTAGENAVINATIENTGDETATQTIEFTVGGTSQDSVSVNLAGGATETVEFTYTTEAADDGATATVASDDASDSTQLTVTEPANFAVAINDQASTTDVTAGEDAVINATVENTGDETATQTIDFTVDGTNEGSISVTLAGGATEIVEFSFTTDADDDGATAAVASDDASDSTQLTVTEPANFVVTINDGASTTDVTAGENAVINATIENTGDETATQTIEFTVGGTNEGSISVTLAGGATEIVEFSFTTDADDDGATAAVASDDASDSTQLTVTEPANFAVAINDGASTTDVTAGENAVINATIENTGDETATQTINFTVGGASQDSVSINLAGGATETVEFTYTTEAADDGGTAEVASDDASDSTQLTVTEPANFAVAINDQASTTDVTAGEDAVINATVENTGDETATQTIEFTVGGTSQDSVSVNLAGGATETVEFTYTTEAADDGATATVASDDASDSTQLTVTEPANFVVTINDGASTTDVTAGENAVINATIENTGDETATQTIDFTVDGTNEGSISVTLAGGATETVEFTYTTEAADNGATAEVTSDDDSDSTQLTVTEPANFAVSINDGASTTDVTAGEDAVINATIENTGDETATQTIDFTVDGTNEGSISVTLAGGATEIVEFSFTTDADDVPEIDLEVATADDSQTVTVDVVGDAEFALAIASALTDEEVVAGATAEVAVDIDNVGTAAGEETLTLFVDGEERATDTVSVDAGGFASAVFEIDTDEGDVGELDLSIEAEESGQTLETIIAVTEPPEEPVFELSILDVGDPVGAGESVTFEAEITNDGGLDGQQAVELVVRGVVRDTETVTLESGESQTVSLAFTPDADDAPSVDATVETADDTATAAVEVQRDGELAVSIADTTTPVVAGEQFTVEVEIENVGDTITEETVELRYDGDVVAETSIELDGGDTTTESFTVETAEDDEGTPIVEARSADDISVQSVSIGAAANFEVAVESVPDSVVAGEEATVEIGIENTGDAEGRQQVQADIGGERLISDRVTLDSGEETTLTAAIETDVDDVGELAVEASSADDAATAEFDVREPPAFELADASVDGPVLTNETLTAEITVENTGGTAGTETVDLFVAPTTVDTASVEVEPNETETVILSYDPEEADIGEIELAAVGSDDLVEASVTVAAPPEPGEFTVDAVSATDPVTAGEELTVRADVVNIGDLTTEETVTLEIEDVEQVVDETELTLDGGEEQRVTLSTELAADRDPGEVEVSLKTTSETATATVEVIEPPEDPLFRIDSLDVPSSVEEGNDIPVTVTVTNIGDLADTQTVAVTADDETGVEEEVTLGAGESEVIETTIENIQVAASEGLDDGESELEADEVEILESIIPLDTRIAVTATTDDRTETASVSVETPAPAAFEIDSVDTPAAVESGDTAAVTVDVENTGEESGTTIVTATLGPATESETVSVDGGETETVTVEVPVAAEARAGTFDRGLTVDIDGDSATASLAIDYGAIQSGLAEAETGETVLVADEEYRESVVVETAGVTLTAPDGATLKPRAGVGIELQAPDVTVEGMTIEADEQTGVRVVAGAIEVVDTEITGADVGINVIGGAETVVRSTAVSDVTTGILLDDADNASVAFSEVTDAATGIEIRSDDVTITSTAVTDNTEGISIRTAAGTDISESDISNNEVGVMIEGGDDHQVATSNIEQNEVNVLTQAAEAGAEPESNTASQTQQLEDTQVVIEEAWLGADPTEVPPEETIIDEADSVEILDPSGTPYESAAFDLTAELPDTTVTFEPLTVEVTVNNTGGLAGRQTVTLAVDGDIVDTADVELEQGATTTVELTYVPETVDVGELPLTIDAGDESVTEAVIVDFEEELPEVDITTFADDDGIVRADGLTEAIDQFRADEIGIELLREVIDAFRSGEPVEFTVETYARFGEDPDVVEIDGLRAAIDDFREDNIGIDLLRSVIDAFRTGDPV